MRHKFNPIVIYWDENVTNNITYQMNDDILGR